MPPPPRRASLYTAAFRALDMPLRTGEGAVGGVSGCERLGTAGGGRQGRDDGKQEATGSAHTSLSGRRDGWIGSTNGLFALLSRRHASAAAARNAAQRGNP